MAGTRAAARLTELHRVAQLRLGAQTAARMTSIWPLLDLTNLDRTFPTWLRAVQALVGPQHQLSAQLAAGYYSTFRRFELGDTAPFNPIVVGPVDEAALATSMLVTGPVSIKSAIARGVDLVTAADIANARSAGAGMRQALSGGRDTISQSVGADPRALGWARAASGRACAFCAMLAGRGPVYSEGSVDFEAHDHCSCSSEPVYSTEQEWPAGSRDYAGLWEDATADAEPDADLLNTFRRAYERPAA